MNMEQIEQIKQIGNLKEKGILTKKEFDLEKQKILKNNVLISESESKELEKFNTFNDYIILINPINKHIVKCVAGYSFTGLILGGVVPLSRGDFKWFFLFLLFGIITFGIYNFIFFPFHYNSTYIKGFLIKGYVPGNEKSEIYLNKKGFII